MSKKLQRTAPKGNGLAVARSKAKAQAAPSKYAYPFKSPTLMAGVVPKGKTAPVMAMDYTVAEFQIPGYGGLGLGLACGVGFPGFQYLSMLMTRPEYRAFASTLSTEITREWIQFSSKQDDDTDSADKIKQIEDEFIRLDVRGVLRRAAEHDASFGRAQIFVDIIGADRKTPLILHKRTIKKGSLKGFETVEAVWTTPSVYNALDPSAPDFYKPRSWFMLGQEVHASRLMTIITRPLPDILKPAYNFAGMSLSQLAEPYVDNWLRTRQSVSDLISNFSITILATAMEQVLQGSDDGSDLFDRADLFTATRTNRGIMLLDKDREEVVQVNTPLSGLSELQAQAQEHMCSVSRTPAIILTGISPTGLNASSEGEIRVFYDWISAQQNAFWREPLEVILKVVQLHLFGEIDPDICFDFVPLYQLTGKELSEIREADGRTATAYINAGVVSPEEVRQQLAKDPESGYDGLDTSVVVGPPVDPVGEQSPEGLEDDDKPAQDHIIEEGGKFKLLSHKGKNLGVFDTREAAQKHEQQVNYFKAK